MARYRLTARHVLPSANGPACRDAGYEFDSAEMPAHWLPTPACHPLDPEAKAEHAAVMRAAIEANGPHIPGFSHVHDLPHGRAHYEAAIKERDNG